MSASTRDVFVLSGGAARGAVQVGMLQTLLEAGITPCALVGTSVGALNAAFLAASPTVARVHELTDRWHALRTRDIFPGGPWSRLGHLAQRHPYLYSSDALRSLIATWAPVRRLEELPTPLRVTTTPLSGSTAIYHDSGDLRAVLLASTSVPGLFAPVPLPGHDGEPAPHVDGGITDLVPLSGAADFAPRRVFVLDATVPGRLPQGRSPLGVLVASLGVAMRARRQVDLGPGVEVHHLYAADLGTGLTDFSRTADHLRLGRRAASVVLDRLFAAPAAPAPVRRRWFSPAA